MSKLSGRIGRVEADLGGGGVPRFRICYVQPGESVADAKTKQFADQPLGPDEGVMVVQFVAPEPDGGDNVRA